MSRDGSQSKKLQGAAPPARPHLLRLLDGVEVDLEDVVLQPGHEQGAVVRQQQAVHVLGFIHAGDRRDMLRLLPGSGKERERDGGGQKHSQVVENDEAAGGHVLEVGFGEEQDAVLQALDLADVVAAVHLEGGVALQRRPEEGGGVALKAEGTGMSQPRVSQRV